MAGYFKLVNYQKNGKEIIDPKRPNGRTGDATRITNEIFGTMYGMKNRGFGAENWICPMNKKAIMGLLHKVKVNEPLVISESLRYKIEYHPN